MSELEGYSSELGDSLASSSNRISQLLQALSQVADELEANRVEPVGWSEDGD
jgi:hypothetical protein